MFEELMNKLTAILLSIEDVVPSDVIIELESILNRYLSAHSRAQWDNQEARQIIINLIMTKFKKSLGIS